MELDRLLFQARFMFTALYIVSLAAFLSVSGLDQAVECASQSVNSLIKTAHMVFRRAYSYGS